MKKILMIVAFIVLLVFVLLVITLPYASATEIKPDSNVNTTYKIKITNRPPQNLIVSADFRNVRLADLLSSVFDSVSSVEYVYIRADDDDPLISVRFSGPVADFVEYLRKVLANVGYEVAIDLRGRLLIYPMELKEEEPVNTLQPQRPLP